MNKIIILACIVLSFSCTKNQRAKAFGGTSGIKLEKNENLINITWKKSDLWLYIEDTVKHEKYFRENSEFGILNGKIIIK